jgi:hypothetical protein
MPTTGSGNSEFRPYARRDRSLARLDSPPMADTLAFGANRTLTEGWPDTSWVRLELTPGFPAR